jgi:hypothetical protein
MQEGVPHSPDRFRRNPYSRLSATRKGGVGDLGATQFALLVGGGMAVLAALRWAVTREADQFIAWVISLGFVAKLAGSLARFTVMADLYGGRGDFNRYFDTGRLIAGQLRSGSLPEQARETGTPFMDFIAGVVYAVVPNQLWIGFLVFAMLSFVGAYLFLRAFQLTLPDGNHRLYAVLVFFTPTMVFWPSSIGKEAWLVFSLGVAAYGAARVLRRAPFGYLTAATGGAAAFLVRPHMGALFALAFAGAFVLRFRDRSVRQTAAAWLLGLLVIGVGAGYVAVNFGEELPRIHGAEEATFDSVAEETIRRTTTGGSEFDSRPVRNPVDFLHAAVTVPFRPFPTEGHNRQAQLAGLEGVLLFGLILLSLPRLTALPRAVLRQPYVAMATAYTIGFIIAFSNVGNFGILTRQRAQLLPFLFVILAFRWKRQRDERRPVLLPSTVDRQATIEPYALQPGVARGDPKDIGPDLEHTRRPTELFVDLPEGAIQEPRPPP